MYTAEFKNPSKEIYQKANESYLFKDYIITQNMQAKTKQNKKDEDHDA